MLTAVSDLGVTDAPLASWSLPSRAWDGHVLVRHRYEAEHADALDAWTMRGLDNGERVVRILPTTGIEPWRRDRDHPRLAAATDRGQLVFLEPAQISGPDDLQRLASTARAAGFDGVRVAMSHPDHSRAADKASFPTCDAIDRLVAPASVLCGERVGIRLDGFTAGHGSGHLTVHDAVVDASAWLLRSPGALAVAGEVDLCNAATLTDALRAACTDLDAACHDVLEVDCRGWRFVDVAGTRALREGVEPFVRDGGAVVLRRVAPMVARLLRLLGADAVMDLRPAA